jgi:hypothetical protein
MNTNSISYQDTGVVGGRNPLLFTGAGITKKKVKEITWAVSIIPAQFFDELSAVLAKDCNFGPITVDNKEFAATVKAINKSCHSNVPLAAAIRMRESINLGRTIKAHPIIMQKIGAITARYNAGDDILDISRRDCLPPIAVFRKILIERGMSEQVAGKIIAGVDVEKTLAAREREQLTEAWQHDSLWTVTTMARSKEAQRAEDLFVSKFAHLGFPFETQDNLVKAQIAEFGRAVITPDILLTTPVRINKVFCHWIDFKDYVGCNVPYLLRSCKEQAARYTAKWGQGALYFAYGIVEGFRVTLDDGPDPLLLGNYE